ncbi:MAG: ABC transporter permease subunit [Armatimonadota bacterium]|nr:ABC transporter permease subunit [Armatimonadota bacterium]MDR7402597.1 ABC transporter permease subunit [Armatimonadota bacterium]MDR7404036.1 ABC transporter permease subunit [Armatimonadota bacterium]MDR7436801.1 ABC transporter permease subunit [Armatimonadota bacterium]MDR7472748.1 ABC transporter permease subunit [Armatimonadota bacterium]
MSWSVAAAVFRKETVEALRDHRTVLVALLLPAILMPTLTVALPALAERQRRARESAAVVVAVEGETADLLEAAGGIRSVRVPDPEAALEAGTVDAVLRAEPVGGGIRRVVVLYDRTRPGSVVARARVQQALAAATQAHVRRRLAEAGLAEAALVALAVSERDVAGRARSGQLLLAGVLPFVVVLWAVLGGQHAALDTGAGEAERQTLELLLATPAPRAAIAAGKFLAVWTTALAAVAMVVASTVAGLWAGARLPLGLPPVSLAVPPAAAAALVLLAVTVVAFLSAVQLALSLLARSVRQAQQYFTPVYLLVSLPALAAPVLDGWEKAAWAYLVPGLGTVFASRGLLLGTLPPAWLALAVLSPAAGALVGLAASARLLGREEALFRA